METKSQATLYAALVFGNLSEPIPKGKPVSLAEKKEHFEIL